MSSLSVVISNILRTLVWDAKNGCKQEPVYWVLNYADPICKMVTNKKNTTATSTRAICFQISGLFHFTRDYKKCVCVVVIRCFLVCNLIFRPAAIANASPVAVTRIFVFVFAIRRCYFIFLFHLGWSHCCSVFFSCSFKFIVLASTYTYILGRLCTFTKALLPLTFSRW